MKGFLIAIQQILCAVTLCFYLVDVRANEACSSPTIFFPTQTALADARPRFEWAPVPQAKRYRLWLESRLPEGRILLTHDIQTTATNWMPPTPLTDTRALVKLKLFAICENGGADTEMKPVTPPFMRYTIDVSGSCLLPSTPLIKLSDKHLEVTWPTVNGASYYEVMVYSGTDAKLARKNETRDTKFQLQSLTPGVWVISVRPRCSSGFGSFRTQVLNL